MWFVKNFTHLLAAADAAKFLGSVAVCFSEFSTQP